MKKKLLTTKELQKEENKLLNEEVVEALILKYGINKKSFDLEYSPIQPSRKHEWISFKNERECLAFNNPRIINNQEVICNYCFYQISSERINADISTFKRHLSINLYGIKIRIETEDESVNFLEKTAKEIFLQFLFMTTCLPNLDTIYYDGIDVFEKIVNALNLRREKITNVSITTVIEIKNRKIIKLYNTTPEYSVIYDKDNFKYVNSDFKIERNYTGETRVIFKQSSKKDYNEVAILEEAKQKFEELQDRIEVFNSNN